MKIILTLHNTTKPQWSLTGSIKWPFNYNLSLILLKSGMVELGNRRFDNCEWYDIYPSP